MRRNGGFTLMEILIALAIMSLGIVGAIAFFPVGWKSSQTSIDNAQATAIAETVVEAIQYSLLKPDPNNVIPAKPADIQLYSFQLPHLVVRQQQGAALVEIPPQPTQNLSFSFRLPDRPYVATATPGPNSTDPLVPDNTAHKANTRYNAYPLEAIGYAGAGTAIPVDTAVMGFRENEFNAISDGDDNDLGYRYYFGFTIRPAINSAMGNLYEVTVYIYKNYYATAAAGSRDKKPIRVFRVTVSA